MDSVGEDGHRPACSANLLHHGLWDGGGGGTCPSYKHSRLPGYRTGTQM